MMARLTLILFTFILINNCLSLRLPDQITDDEDDLAADMPQNGPDTGSGFDGDDDDEESLKYPKTIKPYPTSTMTIDLKTLLPVIPPGPAEKATTAEMLKTQPPIIVTAREIVSTKTSRDEKSEMTPTPTAALASSGLSTAALAGIISAVVIALILIIIIIVCLVKRSKRQMPSHHHPHQQRQNQQTKGRQQVPQEI